MRLLEVVDLADMLGRMGELKPDPFAMLASREARREACQCARDHANGVYSGLRYDFAWFLFLTTFVIRINIYRRFSKPGATKGVPAWTDRATCQGLGS
jgi:hypothetical protein